MTLLDELSREITRVSTLPLPHSHHAVMDAAIAAVGTGDELPMPELIAALRKIEG